jgi:hypothetical protein
MRGNLPQVVHFIGGPFAEVRWDIPAQDDSTLSLDTPFGTGPFVFDFALAPQVELGVFYELHIKDLVAPVDLIERNTKGVVVFALVQAVRDIAGQRLSFSCLHKTSMNFLRLHSRPVAAIECVITAEEKVVKPNAIESKKGRF